MPQETQTKLRRVLCLGSALRLVWRSAPGWTVANGLLLLVEGTLPIASLYLTKLAVDLVVAGQGSPDKVSSLGKAALCLGGLGLCTLLIAFGHSLGALVYEAHSQTVTDYVQGILHAKSVEVDLAFYERSDYFDNLHRAQQQALYRPTRIVGGLAQAGQNALSLAGVAGLLFSLHWAVAVVLVLATLPGVLVRLKYAKKIYRWNRLRTPAERQAGYLHSLLTGDAAAKEIRLFDLGAVFMHRFRDLRRQLRGEKIGLAARRAWADLAAQTIGALAVFGCYAFVADQAIRGAVTIGGLVMYFQAFQRGQVFLRDLLAALAGLYEDSLFLSTLYELLAMETQVVEPRNPKPVPRPIRTGISFRDVRFRYPGCSDDALADLNFTIRPGEHVALVGENGSGKTTLVKLLCRLYDPTSGAITVDGLDLREFSTTELRREITAVFQDYHRYHLTARENVWLGNTELPQDDYRIADAASRSGAGPIIAGLPSGYDTPLGKLFENGVELSVGQWQKIALARAFLRDAQIIVLDEPTSALDAAAEYEVFRRFSELARDRTAVLISHRLSTVRMADCIYYLERGRIKERGPHDELLRAGGDYARLFELQARNYR